MTHNDKVQANRYAQLNAKVRKHNSAVSGKGNGKGFAPMPLVNDTVVLKNGEYGTLMAAPPADSDHNLYCIRLHSDKSDEWLPRSAFTAYA